MEQELFAPDFAGTIAKRWSKITPDTEIDVTALRSALPLMAGLSHNTVSCAAGRMDHQRTSSR